MIRDADLAKEIMKMVQAQIRMEVALAMVTQVTTSLILVIYSKVAQ